MVVLRLKEALKIVIQFNRKPKKINKMLIIYKYAMIIMEKNSINNINKKTAFKLNLDKLKDKKNGNAKS